MSFQKPLNLIQNLLIFLAISMCFLAILQHPFMGDDLLNSFSVNKGNFLDYLYEMYFGWSGRLFNFLIPGLFFVNDSLLLIYKILSIPCFLLMCACAFYLATGKFLYHLESRQDFIIFSCIAWLGLPVLGTTVVWMTGSIYLWSTTITLLFLSLLFKIFNELVNHSHDSLSVLTTTLIFVLAFFIGTSGLQWILITFITYIFLGCRLLYDGKLISLKFKHYFIFLSFILGVAFFLLAPGNFQRLEYADPFSLLSNLKRFFMFLAGAYFSLGVGDIGRSLWMGALLILCLNSINPLNKSNLINSFFWAFASLSALVPFIPLIHFAAPRVTFISAIFFLILVQSLVLPVTNTSQIFRKSFVGIILLLLVSFDGFVGWAANSSLKYEVENRQQIIQAQILKRSKDIVVPYYSTIPSRLTHMLTPSQDQAYLKNIADILELNSITHDESISAPKPYSLQPLKSIKKSL